MISRGEFVRRLGALTALSLAPVSVSAARHGTGKQSGPFPRIFPERLKKGDLIGLVTPGSPITPDQLDETISKLEGMGFRTVHSESVLSEYGYLAGKDRERADELMEMFTRKDVKGIWCVRGGYGSIRILDLLDYELIRNHPKVFIGYSDITALISAIHEQTGLITFHGPVGISDFNQFTVSSFRNVIMEPSARYRYPYKREKKTRDNPEYDRYTISGGVAEGELTGGNISVLDSMIGSRFEPDFENRIVYLEEIEEKTYRVDKMVFHLLSGTNLKKAAGIVMGVMADCNINDEPRLTLEEALDDLLKPLGIPVSYGSSFGHIQRMVTIPTGIRALFNADKKSLKLMETATV